MKYLNHVTLNTGNVRKTFPGEVDKELYFALNRIVRDSMKSEVRLFDGYCLKSTSTKIGVMGTIFANDGSPILTTACSSSDDGTLWRALHESSSTPLKTSPSGPIPLPYIADRLEAGVMLHMDALQWTGDFARCFGWVVLGPEKIR